MIGQFLVVLLAALLPALIVGILLAAFTYAHTLLALARAAFNALFPRRMARELRDDERPAVYCCRSLRDDETVLRLRQRGGM